MTDFVNDFMEAGDGEDYRKIDELELNTTYQIIQFRIKSTDYGKSLEAEIQDPETLRNFFCFFPERFARKIRDEEKDLKQLNEQKLKVIYKGRVKKAAILEFVK